MLTEKERASIRFYQGDIRKRAEDGTLSDGASEVGFYGIPSAYKTMNCLMFDGIDNEKERIAEGNTVLNPQVYLEIERVVDVFCDIFRAMCKCRSNTQRQIVYRTERGISVQEMKRLGQTISFTSTSKERNPKKYFRKKKSLTLLELIVPAGTPYLDFEETLGDDNYYSDQKEILLPPFLESVLYEGELTAEETSYRDADGQPPQGRYIAVLGALRLYAQNETNRNGAPELGNLIREKKKMAGFLSRLNAKEELSQREIQAYCTWKREFREIIMGRFWDIQSEFAKIEDPAQHKKRLLIEEVEKQTREFDRKRKDYKKHVKWYNIVLSATSVVPIVCVTLSFISELETHMKVAAILASAAAMILTRILKVEAYYLKLSQRTKTCLRLRDLGRQMKYESNWNEQKVEGYVESFRTIMKEDADMSLQNLQVQISSGGELYQNEIIS